MVSTNRASSPALIWTYTAKRCPNPTRGVARHK
jgi:hypothetical protein